MRKLRLPVLVILLLLVSVGYAVQTLGIVAKPGDLVASAETPTPSAADRSPSTANAQVAVVQSTARSAYDISYEEVESMVREAIALAGGLESVVKDGDVVVLKPNLVGLSDLAGLSDSGNPIAEANGVTTDWRVTAAVAKLVRELNPSGTIYVMEGSALSSTQYMMNLMEYTPDTMPWVDEFIAIEKDSGRWHEYNSEALVKVQVPQARLNDEYYVNRRFFEADVVISISCLKTHDVGVVTGGIKNLGIGATPANIYGNSLAEIGRWNVIPHDENLHKWVADYYRCRPADFVVLDGLQGVQNGPNPRPIERNQMNMRLIIAGKDAVATDTVAALIMGWDPQSVQHLVYLSRSGCGIMDPSKIDVLGSRVDQVRKFFVGGGTKTGGRVIPDKGTQSFSIVKSEVSDGTLDLSLDTSSGIVKVEVLVDGKLLASARSDFSSIPVDLSGLGPDEHDVTVRAYDRYLYSTEQSIPVRLM